MASTERSRYIHTHTHTYIHTYTGAQSGLSKDKSELDGKVLKVALSDPSRKGMPNTNTAAPSTRYAHTHVLLYICMDVFVCQYVTIDIYTYIFKP